MLRKEGKFNTLRTINLVKSGQVFLLYNSRLYKFKALSKENIKVI